MTKENIRKTLQESRKIGADAEVRALASVLTEVELEEGRKNKNLSEDEILKIIEKESKKYEDSSKYYAEPIKSQLLEQKAFLEQYLPKKITENEILEEAKKLSIEFSGNKGYIMKAAKEKFGLKIDLGLLAKALNNIK